MDKTLSVINAMEHDGVIKKYAIGGAIGMLFYGEPATTYDLDIFCLLEQPLAIGGPLHADLAARGYMPKDEHVEIEGIPVQFLEPPTDLVREALDNAVAKEIGGVSTRVFQYEYLLAIMVETGRPKDRERLTQALASAKPDQAELKEILKRYNLMDRWTRIVS